MSWQPLRTACFIRAPKTGWASVGLAPTIMSSFDFSTSWKLLVPAPVPNAAPRAKAEGEWQTREQLSTELVRMMVRVNFWVRKFSSLVQREELMKANPSGPCRSRTSSSLLAIRSKASSQEASRKLPSPSLISGTRSRSLLLPNWWANRPLTQVWPRFALPSGFGSMLTISPSFMFTFSEQPTPQ